MNPKKWQGIHERLQEVERVKGDEARVSVGASVSKLLQQEDGSVCYDIARLNQLSVCVAWTVCPEAFDGQPLDIILERAGGIR